MNPQQEMSWWIDQPPSLAQLKKRLKGKVESLTEEGQSQLDWWLLDTFDWNLWQQGEALFYAQDPQQSGPQGRAVLKSLAGEQLLPPQQALPGPPVFWWDLPAGALRDHLHKRVDLWSLQARLALEERTHTWACRDDEGKIIARLDLREQKVFRLDAEETPQHYLNLLTLKPLRGYEQEAQQLQAALQPLLGRQASPLQLSELLTQLELNPELERLPEPLPLNPDAPMEEALRQAGARLFAQARRYEPGILADRDTEHLHQYRVCLRRIRSIFSLMKKTLPEQTEQALKIRLAALARVTNSLRDLDVFLLERQHFMALLPEAFRPGLEQLFRQVEKERRQAKDELGRQLLATAYEDQCHWLEDFFASPALLQTAAARQSVRAGANQAIWKRYQRICKDGRAITESTPDEQVHDLRIQCKKLRYLLDFFAALYPAKQVKRQVKALKGLQTLLGDFNDYAVQQAFLLARLEQDRSGELDAALHGLITLLYQKQLDARSQVMSALAGFDQPALREDFQACYKNTA